MRAAFLSVVSLAIVVATAGLAIAGIDGGPASTPNGVHAGVSPVSETVSTPDAACVEDACTDLASASVTFNWGGADVQGGMPTCDPVPSEATEADGSCEVQEPGVSLAEPEITHKVTGIDQTSEGDDGAGEAGYDAAAFSTAGAGGDLTIGGAELAAVGIGATGLLLFPGARKLLFLLLSPFATRLRRDELLEDGTRRALYEMVNEEPGINLKAMGERLDVAWGTLLHHVRKLEDAHLIVSNRYGKYRRYFPNGGTYSKDERAQLAALASPATARVADAISAHPGRNQREIGSLLDVSPSTVLWHVKRLQEVDLVHTEREGRCVRYYPSHELMTA